MKVDYRLLRDRLRWLRRISYSILCWVLCLVLDHLLGIRGLLEEEGWGILVGRVGIRRLGVNNSVVFLVLLNFLVGHLEVNINTEVINAVDINTANITMNVTMNVTIVDINMVVIDMIPHISMLLLLQHQTRSP